MQMKILWVSPSFLHPTTRGGQIRTLQTLRCLHRRHEIHFIALERNDQANGIEQSSEYCAKSYPVPHRVPTRFSTGFYTGLGSNLFSDLPLSIERWVCPAMKEKVSELLVQQNFDSVVCDFLASAPNIPSLADCVLFQHNVETVLWQRHHQAAKGPIARKLYCSQAARMYEFERSVCRQVRHVIAVSMQDAQRMQSMFEINHVSDVQTGVDVEYFRRAAGHEELFDLVFVGSMDWSANIDGVEFFLREVLPLIHLERPETRLAVVGRQPPRTVLEAGMSNPRVTVTGTVDDVRPYLWGSQVSIVPLRIGGGTRLKIYESMAAGVPVVSTSVGAEGLAVEDGRNILIGDTPEAFARHCLTLLNERDRRDRLSAEAGRLVSQRFSWEQSAREFETILMRNAVGAAT